MGRQSILPNTNSLVSPQQIFAIVIKIGNVETVDKTNILTKIQQLIPVHMKILLRK